MTEKQANIAAIAAKLKGILATATSAQGKAYVKDVGMAAAHQVGNVVGKAVGLHPQSGQSLGGMLVDPYRKLLRAHGTKGGVTAFAKRAPTTVGQAVGNTALGTGVGGGVLAMFGPEKSAAFMEGFVEQCRALRVSPSALAKCAQAIPASAVADMKAKSAAAAAANPADNSANGIDKLLGERVYAGYGYKGIPERMRRTWLDLKYNSSVGRAILGEKGVEQGLNMERGDIAQQRKLVAGDEQYAKDYAAGKLPQPGQSAYSPYPSPGAMRQVSPWTMAGNALYPTTAPVTSPIGFPAPAAPAPQASPAPAPALPSSPAAPAKPMAQPSAPGSVPASFQNLRAKTVAPVPAAPAPVPAPGPATKALAYGQQAATKTAPSPIQRPMPGNVSQNQPLATMSMPMPRY